MNKKKHIKLVEELFELISDKDLAKIGDEQQVDFNVSRLRGDYMLKLLIFGMVRKDNLSTHTLEKIYNSLIYSALSKKGGHQTRHSSLAHRLNHMNPAYLESVFESLLTKVPKRFLKRNPRLSGLVRYDSTMRQVSSALIERGMRVGSIPQDDYRKLQLKFTVGLRGAEGWPDSAEFFDDQAHLSEEKALKEAIMANSNPEEDLVVFDMGISSRNTFATFDEQGLSFITRGADNLRYEVLEAYSTEGETTEELQIVRDSKVYLYQGGNKCFEHPFRLVEGVDQEGNTLYFITNIWDLSASMIAELYRLRWDLEAFFRFVKQELSFSHLLSRSYTGILNQLHATMITALLLLAFKKKAQIDGYKDAKLYFEHALLLVVFKELSNKLESNEITQLVEGRSDLFISLLS